jgi:hypothetical protein
VCAKLFPELFTSDFVLETILSEIGTSGGSAKKNSFGTFCQKTNPEFIKSMAQSGKLSSTRPRAQSVSPQINPILWNNFFPNLNKISRPTTGTSRRGWETVVLQYISLWQVMFPHLNIQVGGATTPPPSETDPTTTEANGPSKPTTTRATSPKTTTTTTTKKPDGSNGPNEGDKGPNNRTRRPPKYKKNKENCKNPPKKHPPKPEDEDDDDDDSNDDDDRKKI